MAGTTQFCKSKTIRLRDDYFHDFQEQERLCQASSQCLLLYSISLSRIRFRVTLVNDPVKQNDTAVTIKVQSCVIIM